MEDNSGSIDRLDQSDTSKAAGQARLDSVFIRDICYAANKPYDSFVDLAVPCIPVISFGSTWPPEIKSYGDSLASL